MQTWKVQDAKARFSEFLDTCMAQGPQAVSKRGDVKAVLVPIAEWERLRAGKPKYTLKELLTSDAFPRADLDALPREKMTLREPPEL